MLMVNSPNRTTDRNKPNCQLQQRNRNDENYCAQISGQLLRCCEFAARAAHIANALFIAPCSWWVRFATQKYAFATPSRMRAAKSEASFTPAGATLRP